MGDISQIKEMLNANGNNAKGKNLIPFPVSTGCKLNPTKCAAYWHERRCRGKACPWGEGK